MLFQRSALSFHRSREAGTELHHPVFNFATVSRLCLSSGLGSKPPHFHFGSHSLRAFKVALKLVMSDAATPTAPAGLLYTYDISSRAAHRQRRILAVAALAGLEVSISTQEQYTWGVTNFTSEFREKFPTGLVPAFETADGVSLFL